MLLTCLLEKAFELNLILHKAELTYQLRWLHRCFSTNKQLNKHTAVAREANNPEQTILWIWRNHSGLQSKSALHINWGFEIFLPLMSPKWRPGALRAMKIRGEKKNPPKTQRKINLKMRSVRRAGTVRGKKDRNC